MKKGPKQRLREQIAAQALEDTECEKFVRSHMTPEAVASAKKAIVAFNTEDRGKPVSRK